jgi:hypothetical protein
MGVTVLVTINNYDLPEIKSVKSFNNLDWESIDCLIFHSSSDSDIEIIRDLSNMKGLVDKVIYINKNINPLYYCIFTGLDADIYDTEDSLMDSSVMTYLIDSYKTTGMTIKSPNADVETLAKCIATISSKNIENLQKLVSNDFWVRTLNTAVSNVDNALSRASQINIDIVEMLVETTKLIDTLESGHESTSREMDKLRDLIDDMQNKTRSNSTFIFGTYRVPVQVQKVLYIKAYGNCRYLNSFILAYQHYLKMSQQYSSKVLLALPKLKVHMQRYKNISRLAQDSVDMMDLGASNLYVTFEPKKMVMDAFFNQTGVGVFIVIDLIFGDILVEGHQVETFNALSGASDFERFNLRPERAIFTLAGHKDSIRIPHIKDYSDANEHTRRTMYFDKCSEMFKILDKVAIKAGR